MKHQHADLMLQYALDAMETDNAWERWECYSPDYGWLGLGGDDPQWHRHLEFRRKADAPPVPWHLLEAHKSTDMSHKQHIGVYLDSEATHMKKGAERMQKDCRKEGL